jgi:hypothetical protein
VCVWGGGRSKAQQQQQSNRTGRNALAPADRHGGGCWGLNGDIQDNGEARCSWGQLQCRRWQWMGVWSRTYAEQQRVGSLQVL